jgi:CheY-like chemotaxis protein
VLLTTLRVRTKLILLVEDDPIDAELAVRRLNRMDGPVEVQVAVDGIDALERLYGDEGQMPDLVILDLGLPNRLLKKSQFV